MNLVDLISIIVILLFGLEGLRRNFLLEILDLISFILAFFLSLRFYNFFSTLLENKFLVPHSISTILAFVLFWFAAEALFIFISREVIYHIHLNINKYPVLNKFSFFPASLRGLVLMIIVLISLGSFPIQPGIKVQIKDSKFGSQILKDAVALENPINKIFGGIGQDSLTFVTVKPESEENINLGFKTLDFTSSPSLENQMIGLVNSERQKRGIKTLQFDPKLQFIAREHSADMFERGYFSHYSPEGKTVADRANAQGIKYLVIGENLAYAPDLMTAHNGLMNSPEHRANILSTDYNKIGIGIMDGGVYGLMITQVFTN